MTYLICRAKLGKEFIEGNSDCETEKRKGERREGEREEEGREKRREGRVEDRKLEVSVGKKLVV